MNLSEPFVRRPVMTVLVMAGILIFGVAAYRLLPVSTLPNVDFPTIQVTAELPGASPETMAAAVATPLEKQFTTIAGIDQMTSVSGQGSTAITIQFSLDRDIDAAAQDVNSAIATAVRQLPPTMSTPPTFRKVNPADFPVYYLALTSDTMPLSTVNEYAETFLAQRISTISGVAQVQVYGQQKYAVRVQVDPSALAARGVGINEVQQAVANANVNLPTGTLYGKDRMFAVQATGQLYDAEAFQPIIVAYRNGSPVRLGELGRVIDSVQTDKVAAWFKDKRGIVLAIQRQPGVNTIEVVESIKKLLPTFRAEVPPGIDINVLFDRSVTIRSSVNEVQFTLLLALALVVMVIFVFLRNVPATIIPSVALPMSIIGTFALMYVFGYSIDNISLMALTLCVGFVVDDAIVMLENISRHIEMGKSVMQATLDGSKEIAFTIVSMTISLAAVFIPVFFMGGILGRLLHEFAVVIIVAVLISGFVSLTLTPMMCSRILKPHGARQNHGRTYMLFERGFDAMRDGYAASLRWVLRHQRFTMFVFLAIVVATGVLFARAPKGFLPSEDSGQLFCITEGPQDISFEGMVALQSQVAEIIRQDPNVEALMSFVGASNFNPAMNSGRMTITLKPFGQRKNADEVVRGLRPKLARLNDIKAFVQNVPAIRIGGQLTKAPYQYVVQGASTELLYSWAPRIEEKLRALPGLVDVTSDLQISRPQVMVEIQREKASSLGVSAQQIEAALNSAYGFFADLDHLHRDQPVLGDPRARAALPDRPIRAADALHTLVHRRAGPVGCCRKAFFWRRPAVGDPPRPASVGDIFIRSTAGRGALAGDRRGAGRDARTAGAGDAQHLLSGHRAGVREIAAGHGHPAADVGPRHLSRARHSLRELHPSADDPLRTADRRSGRAAHADGVRRRAQHVRLRRHHHAGRHREEERDHDDRLRDRGAAQGRHARGGGHLSGGIGPLPADHDDHHGGADGQPADRARLRRRRRRAHAARPGGGRRPAAVAGADAVHHAGDLPVLREPERTVRASRPGARRAGRAAARRAPRCPPGRMPRCGAISPTNQIIMEFLTQPASGIELPVNLRSHGVEVLAFQLAGQCVTESAVDPVEHPDLAFARVAKRRLTARAGLVAHVEREPPSRLILIHELRHRTAFTRQQPSAHQRKPGETRSPHAAAEPLGKPRHQMRFLVSPDLHRMAHLGRIRRVRNGGLARDACSTACRRRIPRMQLPTRHAPDGEPDHRATSRHAPAQHARARRAARAFGRMHQPLRQRFVEHPGVKIPQCLALAAVGGNARCFLRTRCEVGLDVRAPRLRQPAVDVGLQLRFGYRNLVHGFTSPA